MALEILDDLYTKVKVELPLAPDLLIKQRLRQVGIDFCERTDMWTEPYTVTSIDGTLIYPITHSAESDIRKIISAKMNGYELSVLDYELDGENIVFGKNPFPNEILVVVSLKPNANKILDEILTHYERSLVMGTVASLLKLPGRPWTNIQASEYYQRDFFRGITSALTKVANKGLRKHRGLTT